jgi:hypothetical protein
MTETRIGEVAQLGVTAVKGTRLECPERIEVGAVDHGYDVAPLTLVSQGSIAARRDARDP